MANIYVRSTDGNNADSGATWALAKATIAGAAAIDAAGDVVYLSQAHAESTAGAVAYAGAGTNANPTRLICGDDAAEPPTAVSGAATVTTTSGDITVDGSMYGYGITFTTAGRMNLNTAGTASAQLWENCSFRSTNAGSGGGFSVGSTPNVALKTTALNSSFRFGGAAQVVRCYGDVTITGGSVLSGGTSPTSVFAFPTDRTSGNLICSGFDFSNLSASVNLFASDGGGVARGVVRDSKLPASWSGSLVAGTVPPPGQRFEMHNCDSSGTNYRLWVEDYAGSVKSETTIVRTGGASDGATPLSWRLASSANARYPNIRLESPEIFVWNDTTGSSKTATVEFVHDTNVAAGQGAGTASAFQDSEIWLEVLYLSDSGAPIATFISDVKADVLATAADQASSSETWATTGMTTPMTQALSVTFTPQMKGYVIAKVVIGKASKTIYIDPKITVT